MTAYNWSENIMKTLSEKSMFNDADFELVANENTANSANDIAKNAWALRLQELGFHSSQLNMAWFNENPVVKHDMEVLVKSTWNANTRELSEVPTNTDINKLPTADKMKVFDKICKLEKSSGMTHKAARDKFSSTIGRYKRSIRLLEDPVETKVKSPLDKIKSAIGTVEKINSNEDVTWNPIEIGKLIEAMRLELSGH